MAAQRNLSVLSREEGLKMVIADTSVWINHFRSGDSHLEKLLLDDDVICHPFIIGELACGNIKNRKHILTLLQALPGSQMIADEEILPFIESKKLHGAGLGLIDVHLLASALLSNVALWTMDKNLKAAAVQLKVAYE